MKLGVLPRINFALASWLSQNPSAYRMEPLKYSAVRDGAAPAPRPELDGCPSPSRFPAPAPPPLRPRGAPSSASSSLELAAPQGSSAIIVIGASPAEQGEDSGDACIVCVSDGHFERYGPTSQRKC